MATAQDVRQAVENMQAAEAVFRTLKAIHTSCGQDLKVTRCALFEWRCANRQVHGTEDPVAKSLQNEVGKAKLAQEEAWQESHDAWDDLHAAKQEFVCKLKAYNAAASSRRIEVRATRCKKILDVCKTKCVLQRLKVPNVVDRQSRDTHAIKN
ncbi:hypothetical protein FI667_g8254, partial [Globisporangium splendens]